MQDLNDLFFFAEVVAHGGFAAAGRALRQPKSKLSRRVAELEARLGVRLIERSSRRFRVTEVGQAFYERCRSVMTEVAQAEAVVAEAQGEPHGTVRFSCPLGLMDPMARVLAEFMARHPRVKLHVVAANRRIDLIEERIDVALRVRTAVDADATLTMRTLARSHRILAPDALTRQYDQASAIMSTRWTRSRRSRRHLPRRGAPDHRRSGSVGSVGSVGLGQAGSGSVSGAGSGRAGDPRHRRPGG